MQCNTRVLRCQTRADQLCLTSLGLIETRSAICCTVNLPGSWLSQQHLTSRPAIRHCHCGTDWVDSVTLSARTAQDIFSRARWWRLHRLRASLLEFCVICLSRLAAGRSARYGRAVSRRRLFYLAWRAKEAERP